MITENDIGVLLALFEYYVLTRVQIQGLLFPGHQTGRATRKRLAKLFHHGYIGKSKASIPIGSAAAVSPVYYLAKAGAEALATYFDDESYASANTRKPRLDLLFHWVAISEFHIRISQAIADQNDVKLLSWVNEWQVVNPKDANCHRFYLHTVLSEQPPLSCSPDAGFVLLVNGVAKVFYVEVDRNTSGIKQIAASKTPGYAELARRGLHKSKHFPMATFDDFSVLVLTSHEGRRNRLARKIADEPGASRWMFCTSEDLSPETFLYEPIFVDCTGETRSIVKRPVELKSAV